MTISGFVLTPGLQPIFGANVSIVGSGLSQATTGSGAFAFKELEPTLYTVTAAAPGYQALTMTLGPDQESNDLRFILDPLPSTTPHTLKFGYSGFLQCALEAVIVSPSCDSVLVETPVIVGDALGQDLGKGPRIFQENQSFTFVVDRQWKTLVFDLVFHGDDHPGLDGLRLVLRGTLDPESAGSYEQYGRWRNSTSYTVRVDPDQEYPEGTRPTDANDTGFQADIYPGSHASKPAGTDFLGVGFGNNVRFDLYVTAFYVDPAPADWSIRAVPA